MQTTNIITTFRNFIYNIASDAAKETFEKYCLGKGILENKGDFAYTSEEYIDTLAKIIDSAGEGYSFMQLLYIRTYDYPNVNIIPNGLKEHDNSYSLFYTQPKKEFIKHNHSFDFWVLRPASVFIALPKLFDYINNVYTHEVEGLNMIKALIDLIEEWKAYFFSDSIDVVNLSKNRLSYIPPKHLYVYFSKYNIVTANFSKSSIVCTSPAGTEYYCYLSNSQYPIKNIMFYD